MPTLRVDVEIFRERASSNDSSTFLVVCILDLSAQEDVIDVKICPTGQIALDLLNKLDRPNSDAAVVGVQIALPPQLGTEGVWTVEPILEFMRMEVGTASGHCDIYAYHVASGRFFADNQEIARSSIKSQRSIYQASNVDTDVDPELEAFQAWIAQLLSKLMNEPCVEI
ncbi:hypothetical protein [Pseudomonas sp. SID14000]|uniref:hypothetical protein n=1 Tax=Pseudomonas sp. SID14000 TaxID=1986221 RepID=UPI000B3CBDA4|nr:hypothetical protein [Pseudomonas sp. SID14000]